MFFVSRTVSNLVYRILRQKHTTTIVQTETNVLGVYYYIDICPSFVILPVKMKERKLVFAKTSTAGT